VVDTPRSQPFSVAVENGSGTRITALYSAGLVGVEVREGPEATAGLSHAPPFEPLEVRPRGASAWASHRGGYVRSVM
jgi:hypothetical protein